MQTLRDSNLRAAALRICEQRGLAPAASLDEPPLLRSRFHADQTDAAISRRWGGRYDSAAVDHPQMAVWLRNHLAAPQVYPSALIAGRTGTGKTHQAVGTIRAIAHHHAESSRSIPWAAVTHPDLAHQLRPKSDDSHEHALDAYLDTGLLLLDDLGATTGTPWMVDCLQRLVDHRWTRRLATIYTTNVAPDALQTAVGDRVWSRLGDATHVHLTGTDRRWT